MFSGCLCAGRVAAQDSIRTLTLQQAQELALQQNRLLKMARLRVEESKDSVDNISSRAYPNLGVNGGYLYSGKTDVVVPQGKLGNVAGIPIPTRDYKLFEGNHNMVLGGVSITQPVTQLSKISTGVQLAKTGVSIAQTQVTKAEWQVKQGVEKLYYGILLSQQQKKQADANIELTQVQLYDVESALLAGETDSTNHYGLQAQLAGEQEKALQADYASADYMASLDELMGLPVTTQLQLAPPPDTLAPLLPVNVYLQRAAGNNPDIQAAGFTQQKAALGVAVAKKEYIPDVSVIGGLSYQSIFDFLPAGNYNAGVLLTWKILDFGTRKSVVHQRLNQQKEAAENFSYTSDHVSAAVQKAYRQVLQAAALMTAAQKAVTYREKQLQFKEGQKAAGTILKRDVVQTRADLAKARTDLFAAQINYRIAYTDLLVNTGVYP